MSRILKSEWLLFNVTISFVPINNNLHFNSKWFNNTHQTINHETNISSGFHRFIQCAFIGFTSGTRLVHVNNPNVLSSFSSCLFWRIFVGTTIELFLYQSIIEGVLDRCFSMKTWVGGYMRSEDEIDDV